MVDTSAIHTIIRTAKRRLKIQSAMEMATLASIVAIAVATAAVVAARLGSISAGTANLLFISSVAIVVIGALVGALKPFSQNYIATLVDRSSDLSDRLATACAFERKLNSDAPIEKDARAMMRLAILDATRFADKATPKLATPFRWPKDGKAALSFALIGALVAGISLSKEASLPTLHALSPKMATPGSTVTATGSRLLTPSGQNDTQVFLGSGDGAIALPVTSVTPSEVQFQIPKGTPLGLSTITIRAGGNKTKSLAFEVIDEKDPRAIPEENLVLDEEDLDYAKDLVADIHKTAEANEDLALEELAKELDDLIKNSEDGKLTKKELLEAITKAEEKYMEGSEESVEESIQDLKNAGKELKKQKLTKDLGKALEKGNLDQARKEMEKLAQQLDDNKLSDKDQQKIGEAMEKAAAKMEKAQKHRDESMDKRIAKKEDSIRKLQKKQQEARTQSQKEEMVRRLKKEQRELKRMQRNKEDTKKDSNKRQLKQLRKKMKAAAKELKKKKQNQQQQQKSRRQVSKSMRDMAKSTGKVSQDKRKMANKAKVASQMSDLKEAMRRAKRKGKQGGKSRFGKNRRRKDFASRARGGKGKSGAWKPGQGQGSGQGQQGQGGQGNQPGGKEYGDGHDPNLMGKSTAKSGDTTDESLQGVRGKGPSTRETILTSAQKGFSSKAYKNVYARYKTIVEEDIKAEKVPAGYKYYVNRYFQKIKAQNK